MKKSKIISISLSLLLLLLFIIFTLSKVNLNTSAGKNQISDSITFTIKNNELINDSLEGLLLKTIRKTTSNFEEIKEFTIAEVNDLGNSIIVTILYTLNQKTYQGFLVAKVLRDERFEFHDIEINEMSTAEPISMFHYIGTSPSRIEQKISIISGYVNNKNISKIYFFYSDGRTVAVVLSDKQNTFTEINVGGEAKIVSVIAVSNEEKIIFEKNY